MGGNFFVYWVFFWETVAFLVRKDRNRVGTHCLDCKCSGFCGFDLCVQGFSEEIEKRAFFCNGDFVMLQRHWENG